MLPKVVIPSVKQNTSILAQALYANNLPAIDTLCSLYRDGIFVDINITDAAGFYKFDDLIAGNYRVKISFKDGSDPLWVNCSSANGPIVSPFDLSSATPPALSISSVNGETSVAVVSPGSGYSKYAPPLIVADDGYVASATVTATGGISSVTPIIKGNGTATSANVITMSGNPPIQGSGNTIVYGTAGATTDNGDALASKFTAIGAASSEPWYSLVLARIGGAYPPWGSESGISQNASAWQKKYDLLFNSTIMIVSYYGVQSKCLAWYPVGTITVHGDNPNALSVLASDDGYKLLSLSLGDANSSITAQIYHCEVIDRLYLGHPIESNPPGAYAFNNYPVPDCGCGVNNSYADFAQKKAASLQLASGYSKPKNAKIPIRNDLPAKVKDWLNILGISGEVQNFIRYLNNYSTYSALENVADARATQQIKDAKNLYGENSNEYKLARQQAFDELNLAKGFLANEFVVKPTLDLFTGLIDTNVLDSLRGLPSGATRSDIVNVLGPIMTSAFDAYYQIQESPTLQLALAAGLLAGGWEIAGGLQLASLAIGLISGSAQDSASKSVDDFITQCKGINSQPSWLSGYSYDTYNLFGGSGARITFGGGGYTSTPIDVPDDAARPYVWNNTTKLYAAK